MAQLEDGFTQIANKIMKDIYQIPINGSQMRILIFVWRHSFGFKRKFIHIKNKTEIAKEMKMHRPQLIRESNILLASNILIEDSDGFWGYQKHPEKWDIDILKSSKRKQKVSLNGDSTKCLQMETKSVSKWRQKVSLNGDTLLKKEKRKKEIYYIDNIGDISKDVIDYLNAKANKNFKYTATNKSVISARLKEGFTLDNLKHVVDVKAKQWLNDEKMNAYLCPTTLFRPQNFERYLNEKGVSSETYITPL